MTAFLALADADQECGGKAELLGRLVRAGFAVPGGVVLHPERAHDGAAWASELPELLDGLGGERFAVRSSALGEDGRSASFAGQFHTSLDVPATHVERAIHQTLASRDQATAYADAVGASRPGSIGVIVQRMLAPDAAGVAFTRHPTTGERTTFIEAVRGLGEPLVSGHVSPEPDALTVEQAREIAGLAEQVEALLGGGQDVEWAITGSQVWVLQARPITAVGAEPAADLPRGGEDPDPGLSLSGTPASPGTAGGLLRVVRGPEDFPGFGRGEILVCRSTSPAWMPVLARAAAVVTERGGVLSHAAIVARELRIPAITDVPRATGLPDRSPAVVDGTAGTLRILPALAEDGR